MKTVTTVSNRRVDTLQDLPQLAKRWRLLEEANQRFSTQAASFDADLDGDRAAPMDGLDCCGDEILAESP